MFVVLIIYRYYKIATGAWPFKKSLLAYLLVFYIFVSCIFTINMFLHTWSNFDRLLGSHVGSIIIIIIIIIIFTMLMP